MFESAVSVEVEIEDRLNNWPFCVPLALAPPERPRRDHILFHYVSTSNPYYRIVV